MKSSILATCAIVSLAACTEADDKAAEEKAAMYESLQRQVGEPNNAPLADLLPDSMEPTYFDEDGIERRVSDDRLVLDRDKLPEHLRNAPRSK